MKNIIFPLFLVLMILSVASCKKDPKSDKEKLKSVENPVDSTMVKDANKEVVVQKPTTTKKKKKPTSSKKSSSTKTKKKSKATVDGTMRIPGTSFSTDNSMSKKYIRDYESYVRNYKKAVDAKDMDSFLKLSDASSSLSRQYTRLISVLPGEEIEKLSTYMQVKSKQLDKLSSKL